MKRKRSRKRRNRRDDSDGECSNHNGGGGSSNSNTPTRKKLRNSTANNHNSSADQIAKRKFRKLMNIVVKYMDSDGRLLSEPFMKLPSKRELPDYYDIIKKPIDIRKIMQRIDESRVRFFRSTNHHFLIFFFFFSTMTSLS